MAKAWKDEYEFVEVDGRRLRLKNLHKVMYPETGTTKAELFNYYAKIAPYMLPHLKERAVTMKRWPHGVADESFFEKNRPSYAPDWIPGVDIASQRTEGKVTHFALINTVPALIWFVNLGTIEFHVPLAGRRSPDRPKTMVYDLDPGEGTTIVECAAVALLIRGALQERGLESFPKTSGSKGMQLYVPLNRRSMTFDKTKDFAHALAEAMAADYPDQIVSKMSKKLRRGKVFIDWSQNSRTKTTVCAYSARGREIPRASTPITWQEVASTIRSGDPDDLAFSLDETVARAERDGDLFEPVLELEQSLPRSF